MNDYVTREACDMKRDTTTQTMRTLSEAVLRLETAQKEISAEQRRINERFSRDLTELKVEFGKATTKLAVVTSVISALATALLGKVLS